MLIIMHCHIIDYVYIEYLCKVKQIDLKYSKCMYAMLICREYDFFFKWCDNPSSDEQE